MSDGKTKSVSTGQGAVTDPLDLQDRMQKVLSQPSKSFIDIKTLELCLLYDIRKELKIIKTHLEKMTDEDFNTDIN